MWNCVILQCSFVDKDSFLLALQHFVRGSVKFQDWSEKWNVSRVAEKKKKSNGTDFEVLERREVAWEQPDKALSGIHASCSGCDWQGSQCGPALRTFQKRFLLCFIPEKTDAGNLDVHTGLFTVERNHILPLSFILQCLLCVHSCRCCPASSLPPLQLTCSAIDPSWDLSSQLLCFLCLQSRVWKKEVLQVISGKCRLGFCSF